MCISVSQQCYKISTKIMQSLVSWGQDLSMVCKLYDCTLELKGCMKDQDLTHRLCWEWLAEEEVLAA